MTTYTTELNMKKSKIEHGLKSFTLHKDGVPTRHQIVEYENDIMNVLGSRYVPISHEQVGAVVADVAEREGLEIHVDAKESTWGRRWGKYPATISHDKRRVIFTLLSTDKVFRDVGFDGKEGHIRHGVQIMNSLDGSTSLPIIPYTERTICNNQLPHWASTHNNGVITAELETQIHKLDKMEELSQTQVVSRFYHNKVQDMGKVSDAVVIGIEDAMRKASGYAKLQELAMTTRMAISLANKLPSGIIDECPYIEVKDDFVRLTQDAKAYEVMNWLTNFQTFHAKTKSVGAQYNNWGQIDRHFFTPEGLQLLEPIKAQ